MSDDDRTVDADEETMDDLDDRTADADEETMDDLDDRTVDADEGTMDELRRLAADVRGEAGQGAGESDDRTVDADEETMDELRRLAADVRAAGPTTDEPGDDGTVTADAPDIEELQRYAAEAQRRASGRTPPPSEPAATPENGDAAPFDPPMPGSAVDGSALRVGPDLAHVGDTPDVATGAGRAAAPTSIDPADATADRVWRPPARMVMPTEPEKRHEVHHGPWRTIAFVLAGLVVALMAFLLVWILVIDGGDEPVDEPEIDPLTSLPIDDAFDGGVEGGDGDSGDVTEGGG